MNRKYFFSPLPRIIIGCIVVIASVAISQSLLRKGLEFLDITGAIKTVITSVVPAFLAVVSYSFLYSYYEDRNIDELTKKNLSKWLIFGISLGFFLQALTIVVIYIKGGYSIQAINSLSFILVPLALFISSSIIEEIIFRGIIFRITEEKLGSYIALLISSIIFGLLHISNPNSSILAGVGLIIQAGVLLGTTYIYSRNLWFSIAVHFGWNFTQSAIFGANVSGISFSKSLITSEIVGPVWYTGGEFGPEGSVQATLFCFIAAIIFLRLSKKENKIIKPFWSK